MKNLRLEITQSRRSLEESRYFYHIIMYNLLHLVWFWVVYYELHARSDTERLQCLAEKQNKEIAENKLYIKELEDRESILAHNVITYLIKK